MEITTHRHAGLVELEVRGTLDSTWAAPLSSAIDEVIRGGSHRLLLNLRDVGYLSSAGISVLIHAHRQLTQIQGFFGVCELSPSCLKILRLTGLESLLVCDGDSIRQRALNRTASTAASSRIVAADGYCFERYDLDESSPLRCRMFGAPPAVSAGRLRVDAGCAVAFPSHTCGLGLGALGSSIEECRDRYGEVLVVAGNAAHLPGRDGAPPDYQMARESFVPEVQLMYGAQFTSTFSRLIRFEPGTEVRRISLSALIRQCLTLAETDLAGIVLCAESAGLVGASVRNSTAMMDGNADGNRFGHPAIRRWLSFTPERAYQRTLVLAAGLATRQPAASIATPLSPFLRPMGAEENLFGHFHAAVFGYRPVKKGPLDLGATAAMLFETEDMQALLHLLRDDRDITGAGESDFVSGACWIGPVAELMAEKR